MFPFLNDWGTVGSLSTLAIATAQKYTSDWEVIIVNDGSNPKDRKALEDILTLVKKGFPDGSKRIRIINHEKNRGYGGALRSGFAASTKDYIFYTDCDAQYDPRELENLIVALEMSVGMVNGYKIKRHDPVHRIIMGRVYHHIVKILFQLPIRDTDCDFRLIKREVFSKVKLFETTGTICVELVKKIDHEGYRIKEVPVHHFWRTSGKSQFFNVRRLAKTATNLLRLWGKLIIQKEYYR